MMPQEIPTEKVDPKEIMKLYNKDPEELTRDDLKTLVADLRAKRETFLKTEESKKMKDNKAKKKEPSKQLSLDDIGL